MQLAVRRNRVKNAPDLCLTLGFVTRKLRQNLDEGDLALIANISDWHNGRALFNTAVAVLVIVAPVLSHDYWFEPEKFFVSVGDTLRVRLFVGEGLKADEERVLQH